LAKQFDVVENLNPDGQGAYPYLVILQHNRISSAGSIIVAPLVLASAALKPTRLHPVLAVSNREYVILLEELAAIPRQVLGHVVGSAEMRRYQIVSALDLLFTGI
jgi:toxin CcdB